MKKIVSLILALCLICAVAVASANTIPANRNKLENLPDMPEAPSMYTKRNGDTVNVTLGTAVDSLVAVSNSAKDGWNEVEVVLDESKAAGTLDLTNFKKSQPGTGTYGSYSYVDTLKYDIDAADAKEWGLKAFTNYCAFNNGVVWGTGHGQDMFEEFLTKNNDGSFTYKINFFTGSFGWYNLGYAYEAKIGETIYRYDRSGKLTQLIAEVPGANYFEDDPAPAKTIVTWSRIKTDVGYRMYISNIKVVAADESAYSVDFASGGKKLRVK